MIKFWASQVALVVKNPPTCQCRWCKKCRFNPWVGKIWRRAGLGRFRGGGHVNPLQYSCLENPMDREAWRAVAHRIAKSRAWLRCLSTHTYTIFNSCDYSGILLEHILKKRWKLHFHRCVLTLTFFFSLKETPIDNNVAVSNWAKEWWMKQKTVLIYRIPRRQCGFGSGPSK